jgi:hypothetical protein
VSTEVEREGSGGGPDIAFEGMVHINSGLRTTLTIACYVIGTVCVSCFAAYWYYAIREDQGPVLFYTLYKYWPWFVLGLVGLVSAGIPPAFWFYGAIRRTNT